MRMLLILLLSFFVFFAFFVSTAFAINPTPNLANHKAGDIILVKDVDVPLYCNFQSQVVKIGFNKKDDIIYACVAIKGKRSITIT